MIQCYRNIPEISPVYKSRKETISEYVTKGHIAMYTILF